MLILDINFESKPTLNTVFKQIINEIKILKNQYLSQKLVIDAQELKLQVQASQLELQQKMVEKHEQKINSLE